MRNVPGIVFAIVFVTWVYIYPKSFIPKYFMLNDLLRKNYFHGLEPHQMTAIIRWKCPKTFDFAFKTMHPPPSFPANPHWKLRSFQAPSPFFWKFDWRFNPPPPAERGAYALPLFNNFECMFITVKLIFFLKLRTLWVTIYFFITFN